MNNVRVAKKSTYTSNVRVRLRDNQSTNLKKLGRLFNMNTSEMIREAISQWVGQAMADNKDRIDSMKD